MKPDRVYFYPGLSDFVKLYVRAREAARRTQGALPDGESIGEKHKHYHFSKMDKPKKIAMDNNLSPWLTHWECYGDLPDDIQDFWNDALKKVMFKVLGIPTFNEIVAR